MSIGLWQRQRQRGVVYILTHDETMTEECNLAIECLYHQSEDRRAKTPWLTNLTASRRRYFVRLEKSPSQDVALPVGQATSTVLYAKIHGMEHWKGGSVAKSSYKKLGGLWSPFVSVLNNDES
jgi:hypothetical protein